MTADRAGASISTSASSMLEENLDDYIRNWNLMWATSGNGPFLLTRKAP